MRNTFQPLLCGMAVLIASPCWAVPIFGASPEPSSPSPPFGAVIGVTNKGVAIGQSYPGTFVQRVIRFSAAGTNELHAVTPNPGSTSGHGFAAAVGVSDDGIVIGTSRVYSGVNYLGTPGVYWDASGTIHQLTPPTPPAGGQSSVSPTAISRNGRIAAESKIYSASNTILSLASQRYDNATSAPTSLATLPTTTTFSYSPRGINSNGTVVGSFADIAVRWKDEVNIEALPSADPSKPNASRFARAVNDADVTVGYHHHYVGTSQRGQFAVRWDANGAATNLGALEAKADGTRFSTATLINGQGDIAGGSTRYTGITGNYAVRWLPNSTTPIALEPISLAPSGVGGTQAMAMNNSGAVVGASSSIESGSVTTAALWTKSSNIAIDLNTLLPAGSGWKLLNRADAISDTGWVGGIGTFDPDGSGPINWVDRLFTMLVPQAGTYGRGDANFDTQINFNDLLILARHYNQTNTTQDVNVADFDLNGTTDFNDLLALARNYGSAASFEADWALAQTLVPEPATLGAAGLFWLGRRKPRRVRDTLRTDM